MNHQQDLLQEPMKPAVKPHAVNEQTPPPQRLYSLDALRGFDMFWIMGAEEIVHALAQTTGGPFWAGF
jgi:hypothetical protein